MLNNIIGQGEFLTSVLQMCRVAAAIANGGYLVQPHVIKQVEGEPTGVYARKKVKALEGYTLTYIRGAMMSVVHGEDGTGRASRIKDIKSAGKTGTSQNPHGEDHAWFIGYAPASEPEIAIAIVVENSGHGGAVAAPVARDFYARYFAPDDTTTVLSQETRGTGGEQ
jgi:cell division protein FtsI/penicillin-binding protein 2